MEKCAKIDAWIMLWRQSEGGEKMMHHRMCRDPCLELGLSRNKKESLQKMH